VIRDRFPVTEHHALVIPKRHVASYFDLGQAEINAINQLLVTAKKAIQEVYETVTGFNVGVNSGESAGQTVFHCHVHLIPRRDGDVDNPRGGVRHVIPGKGNY
jgi:ATP adenylyltransferase